METATPIAAAADWLLELQEQDMPREERAAFAEWLRRSPIHVEEFLRLTELQGRLARWPGLADIDIAALEKEAAQTGSGVVPLGAVAAGPRERASTIRFTGRKWMFGVAASLVLIAAAWLLVDRWTFSGAGERYVTAVGEQRTLMLADGSHVQLNVRSDLSARLDEKTRALQLAAGEALFDVARDTQRPFRVRTPQATIEALGTRFNVHVKEGTTVVTLLEGSVAVAATDAGSDGVRRVLAPGEQLRIADGAAAPVLSHAGDTAAAIAWTERRLVFDDARVSDVVEEFNRYSRQPLVVRDSRLRDIRITAVFDAGNVQAFADSLAEAGGLEVTRQTDGTWLIGPGARK